MKKRLIHIKDIGYIHLLLDLASLRESYEKPETDREEEHDSESLESDSNEIQSFGGPLA